MSISHMQPRLWGHFWAHHVSFVPRFYSNVLLICAPFHNQLQEEKEACIWPRLLDQKWPHRRNCIYTLFCSIFHPRSQLQVPPGNYFLAWWQLPGSHHLGNGTPLLPLYDDLSCHQCGSDFKSSRSAMAWLLLWLLGDNARQRTNGTPSKEEWKKKELLLSLSLLLRSVLSKSQRADSFSSLTCHQIVKVDEKWDKE